MRYAKYKPTGIAWLPEVPEEWEMRPLKEMVSCNDEAISESDTPNDAEIQYVEIGDVEFASGIANVTVMKFGEAPSRARRKTRAGDVIVSTVRTYLRAVAKIVRDDLIVSTGFAVLRPKTVSGDYLSYACVSNGFTDQVIAESTGISYPAISSSKLMRCRIPCPPLSTQRAIVAFLDEKCGKVNRLVAAKEKEVALLKELKQSMIAEAVTRGVRANRRLIPSGIPWLPEVPEGWKMKKMKYLFAERSDKGHPEEAPLCSTQAHGVIPQSLYENRVVVVNKEGLGQLKLVKVGDFVISLRSFQGGIEIAHYQGIISAAYTILEPRDSLNSPYFRYLFKSHAFIQLLQTCVTGIREGQNINYPLLSRKFIPLPPLAEQREIVAYIEARATKIDAAVVGLEKEIVALKEYKQRLIADVVTGQRRVA